MTTNEEILKTLESIDKKLDSNILETNSIAQVLKVIMVIPACVSPIKIWLRTTTHSNAGHYSCSVFWWAPEFSRVGASAYCRY